MFAYNHADWYVDSVLLRARLIAGVPADLVGSLTGLTEGRFPVYARARYADDLAERDSSSASKTGENAANLVESSDSRRSIGIFTRLGAPVVAVNDGVIKRVGREPEARAATWSCRTCTATATRTRTSARSRASTPCRRTDPADERRAARVVRGARRRRGPRSPPRRPRAGQPARSTSQPATATPPGEPAARCASLPVKERLFAHPDSPGARDAGGLEQMADSKLRKKDGFETFDAYFSRPFGAQPVQGAAAAACARART